MSRSAVWDVGCGRVVSTRVWLDAQIATGEADEAEQPDREETQSAGLRDSSRCRSGALPRDKTQVDGTGIQNGALAWTGGKGNERWRVHARVIRKVVAERERRPVTVCASARAEERCSAAVDLAGAVVTCTSGVEEGDVARGVRHDEFLGATHVADAPTDKRV